MWLTIARCMRIVKKPHGWCEWRMFEPSGSLTLSVHGKPATCWEGGVSEA